MIETQQHNFSAWPENGPKTAGPPARPEEEIAFAAGGVAGRKLERQELARLGEEHAARHIVSLGYRIVKRNFRFGKVGEIDIVAYDDDCLVFVEVKARGDRSHGEPEAAVNARKQAQLKRVARMYYYVNGLNEAICRFDVIAVDMIDGKIELRHHKDAFC